MNIVLLSGGSGKRLWPLSNDTQSKQFLKLLKNGRGEYESMVQRVMRQITAAHPDANVFVSCNTIQSDVLHRQLGAVETILEPSRRDTFPAIALAAAYLRYVKGLDEREVFVVCPIDVFANERYFELLADVEALAASGKHSIGLLGVRPTYPSEKYGYILQKEGAVTGFVEKPASNEAERLISGGALWNCGVFALGVGYILRHAERHVRFDSFESLHSQYASLPRVSFDYEVVEHESSIGTAVYDGVWKDLGTWNTLTEEMDGHTVGNDVLVSDTCHNTHAMNMLNIPIIVQGVDDAIVVASHDGILVSSKQGSSFLKPLAEQIHLRPMYEQRHWGNYRVLEYKHDDVASLLVKRLRVDAGQSVGVHCYTEREKMLTVVSGKGILTVEGTDSVVSIGNMVKIPPAASHSLLAATDMELIEVQLGMGELVEDEAIR